MGFLQSLPILGAIVAGVYILYRVASELFGVPGRRDAYRQMEQDLSKKKRITGRNTPRCPVCEGDTEKIEYRFIKGWRCVRYPGCRGFVRAKRGKPRFVQKAGKMKWNGSGSRET